MSPTVTLACPSLTVTLVCPALTITLRCPGDVLAARGDERTGGKLLLMDGKLHAFGARLERCAHMEAPWRMQVDVRALTKARSS